jgi:hypothetical protein
VRLNIIQQLPPMMFELLQRLTILQRHEAGDDLLDGFH